MLKTLIIYSKDCPVQTWAEPENTFPTVRYGGGSIMLRVSLMHGGTGSLHRKEVVS